jgi:hypothetical protein
MTWRMNKMHLQLRTPRIPKWTCPAPRTIEQSDSQYLLTFFSLPTPSLIIGKDLSRRYGLKDRVCSLMWQASYNGVL